MSITTRAYAVRAAVLVAAVAVAVSVVQLSSAPTPHRAAVVADAPVAQTLLPGTTLVAAVPPPAATPAPRHHRASRSRHHARRRHHGAWRSQSRTTRRHHAARHHAGRHHGAKHHPRRHHAAHVRRHRPSRWQTSGGRDISWPQCPRNVGFRGHNGLGQPMPEPGVTFVVVGLTNGRAFTPNPCLDRHLRWVRRHHVYAAAYAFASYPTRWQLQRYHMHGPYDGRRFLGALRNAGHASATYNIRTMRRHGFTTPHIWLDVEPSSSQPWAGRRTWNRAVVQGWLRAYRDAGYSVGFYSTDLLWQHILGGYRPGLPEWRTAGPVSPASALGMCGESSFQGGPAVLAQWWTTHRDYDRLCHGTPRSVTLARYFHKW